MLISITRVRVVTQSNYDYGTLKQGHLSLCMALCRLVQATQEQTYSSLQGLVHPASAAGLLSALHCSLPAEEPYRLHSRIAECALSSADKDALRAWLLEVSHPRLDE